jgi:hypothetical protein
MSWFTLVNYLFLPLSFFTQVYLLNSRTTAHGLIGWTVLRARLCKGHVRCPILESDRSRDGFFSAWDSEHHLLQEAAGKRGRTEKVYKTDADAYEPDWVLD